MLHTKFKVHWPFHSRDEDFEGLLAYMGMAAILVMWHESFVLTFILPSLEGSTWNMVSIGLVFFEEKKFENVESEWPWTKVNEWPWPLIFITVRVLIYLTASTKWYYRLKQFLKNPLFYLFPVQKHKGPNLTLPQHRSRPTQCHYPNKIGRTRAPNAVYQVSRSSAFWFRRRRFLSVLPYIGMVAILVMWPGLFEHTFVSHIPRRLQMKFGFDLL